MNFGVMLLSPIFLVRIFDIRAVGQYGEFILFATVIAGLIDFSISSNLIYFIPKYPDRERQSVTHTTLLILTTSAVGLVVVYFCRGLILARTHYDFILPLILYLLFAVNFEFFESYWLGKKRTDIVLYYSTGRVIVRTTALLISAYVSRDVMTVIRTLIVVEFVKCLFVFAMLRGVLTKRVERGLLREQLRFIVPLGSAVVLGLVNHQIANLFISIKLGVERLALYRIGGQQIPVMGIVRSSVMDVLFPEMAQIGDTERLHLWRRANVVFCFIVFPVYAVFFCYAHIFIEKLFTADYLAAVPLFRIYLTLMVIQSFEMGTPLRAINQNKYFIFGSVLGLSINIGLILLLFRPVGFMAPALSFIVAELLTTAYLANRILHFYRISLRELFLWRRLFTILCCAALALPFLAAGLWIEIDPVVRAVSFSILYLVVYYVAIRRFKIDEVELLVDKLGSRWRDMRASIGKKSAQPHGR